MRTRSTGAKKSGKSEANAANVAGWGAAGLPKIDLARVTVEELIDRRGWRETSFAQLLDEISETFWAPRKNFYIECLEGGFLARFAEDQGDDADRMQSFLLNGVLALRVVDRVGVEAIIAERGSQRIGNALHRANA